MELGLASNACHDLALRHIVGHELFGQNMLPLQHGLNRDRGMQMQRQSDDYRFYFTIVQQAFIPPFD